MIRTCQEVFPVHVDPALVRRLAGLRQPRADECCGRTLQEARGEWRTGQRGVRTEWVGWWCPVCRRHRSLTAGTFLHRSRLPLWLWDVVIDLLQSPSSVAQVADRTGLTLTATRRLVAKMRAAGLHVNTEPLQLQQTPDQAWSGLLATE